VISVGEFLTIHAKVRGAVNINEVVQETIEFANKLTGEAIIKETAMTELSGVRHGLFLSPMHFYGNSPIILLDEMKMQVT